MAATLALVIAIAVVIAVVLGARSPGTLTAAGNKNRSSSSATVERRDLVGLSRRMPAAEARLGERLRAQQ